MPVLLSTALIDAPVRTVAGLLRDTRHAHAALAGRGHRLRADRPLLCVGDEVRIAVRLGPPGLRVPLRTRVVRMNADGMETVLIAGPLRTLTHRVDLEPEGPGTRVRDEITWTTPLGLLGRVGDLLLGRRLVRALLTARADALAESAAQVSALPVVVATALLRDGMVLAAQRTRPPELAGRWELPGGRVEAGETEEAAVARELAEELGARVKVTGRLGTDLPLSGLLLRVHTAELTPDSPEPKPLEHAALQWVDATEIPDLDWLDSDRAVTGDLIKRLS